MKTLADHSHPIVKQVKVFLTAWFVLVFLCLATPLFLASGAASPTASATDISNQDFSKMAARLGAQDAAMVARPSGTVVFAHNPEVKRIPASTIKLLTALAAFHYLNTDFKFTTEFYLDKEAGLKIKGQGDPLLISEKINDIADALALKLESSQRRLNHLVLDNTYFSAPITIPGVSGSLEPYDAPNGALCVNFNTVNFKQQNKTFISAEPQTPLLPMVLPEIKASGLVQGRITLGHQQDEITYYAGHLFQYFLEKAGFEFSGSIHIDRVTPQDRLVLAYQSGFTLDQIVARMLEYSNNFTANQIFIRMGIMQYNAPGTLEKGVLAVQAYARNELGIASLTIAEGSGISRMNQISAKDLLTVLTAFEPHHNLMRKKGRLYYKTGHLKGIRTQAGFYMDPEKGLYPYVILLNTPGKSMYPVVKAMVQALESGN